MQKFFFILLIFGPLQLRALDREAFTITKYDLNVRLEPEQQRLGVRGKMTLRNDSGSPQRNVTLQISSSLNWSSITFEGKPVEYVTQPYVSDIDHTGALSEAIVVLPDAVPPKQSVDIEIGYEGIIPQDTARLTRIGVPADQAKHADWDEISRAFTAVRGIGYVAWYPIATEAVDLAEGDALPDAVGRWKEREASTQFDVNFCTTESSSQPNTIALMNSTRAELSAADAAGSSCTDFTFDKLGNVVPTFAAGEYGEASRPAMDIHFLPGHRSEAQDYASALDEVSPLITKWFGDHRAAGEQKAQTIDLSDAAAASFESGNTLLMPLAGGDTKLLLSAAQQLTNLYFPSPRIWVREGLASYAQARFIEEKEGRKAALAYLEAHRKGLLEMEQESSNPEEDDSLIKASDAFRVQTKAMYVWWMLRELIGENVLDGALQGYKASEDNDFTHMQKMIEVHAHKNLQWFFDDWVYHDRGLPDLRVASVYSSSLPSGGYMLTATVENLGSAGAEVPVTAQMESSEASQKLMVPGKSKASVRIEIASPAVKVTVNDGSVPESNLDNNEMKAEQFNH